MSPVQFSISFSEAFTMVRLALLFVVIVIHFTSFANTRTAESLVPYAIKSLVNEYFANNVHEIEIINFGVRYGQGEETIEKIMRLGNQRMPMKVTRDIRKQLELDEYKLNTSSVLLFDSPENFNQTQHRIVFQHGNIISYPHLVHIHNAEMEDIQVVAYKNFTIDKTNFLTHETLHSIQLTTSFMFTPEACYKNQFKVINRFTRGQKRWENSNFYKEKYMNLYKCEVEFPDDNVIALTHELNFTTKRINISDILLNETFSFYLKYLSVTSAYEFTSYMIHIESRKIVVPPGEVYDDYEKVFLPFDNATWISIAVTIGVAILTILLVALKSPEIQEVIFGRNNRSPLMNFISILLNGDQPRTMMENAPRIFLLVFLFWSMIFR
jgi:hypothetical protein